MKEYDIYLGSRPSRLGTYDIFIREHTSSMTVWLHDMTYRDGLSIINRIILDSDIKQALLYKTATVASSDMIMTQSVEFVGSVFLDIDNQTWVSSEVVKTVAKKPVTVGSDMVLDTGSADLYYKVLGSFDHQLVLDSGVSGMETHYPLGDVDEAIIIDTNNPAANLEKRINVYGSLELAMDITELLWTQGQAESGIVLDSSASAIVKRLRLLSEMDSYTLADFDGMTLEEVDYVILQS